MRIAGSIDLSETLALLAKRRPVFHSEADFQLAFAWQIQLADPTLRVRLETRQTAGVHLDLEVADAAGDHVTAIELKYLTRRWSGHVAGEEFNLAEHSARDIRGYDVIKDITRIEKFVATRPNSDGAVVVITNEAGYWRGPNHARETNADAFRLSEGTAVSGRHNWRQPDGATAAQRPEPLDVNGRYELHWADFSKVDVGPAGTLRQLVVELDGCGI